LARPASALSTVRAAGTLFGRHVIDHYRCGLRKSGKWFVAELLKYDAD